MELLNDIKNYEKLSPEQKNILLAFLIAISSLLSLIDTIITKPFIVKIGLANIVTLILINENRFKIAISVMLARVFISSIFSGTIFSLAFLLSLSGGVFSIIFSIIAKMFIKKATLIGISVIGSFFHIVGQGLLIILIFGFTNSNVFIISIFCLISIATGILTGIFASFVYRENNQ
ncbi:MAG: Gx transporter family protein [Brevinematales bacterium]